MSINKQKIGIIVFVVGFLVVVGGWLSIFFSFSNNGSDENNDTTQLQADIMNSSNTGSNTQNINLNNTQEDNNSDNVTTPQETKQQNNTITSKPVTIIFPPIFSQQQIETINTLIEKESGITTSAKRINSRDMYMNTVQTFIEKGGSVDLLVLPSILFDNASERGLSFQLPKTLQRFYHQSFHDWMYDNKVTVIPFALDPLVLFKNTTRTNDYQLNSSTQLLQYVAQDTSNKSTVAPTFNQSMSTLLLDKKQPFLHANTILEAFLNYSTTYTTLDWLLLIIDTTQQSPYEIPESCTYKSVLCQLIEGQSTLGFGLLSDALSYEETLLNNTEYQITDIPFKSGNNYPILGRGIVVNKNTQHAKDVELWIETYTTLSIETNSIPYPWYLFGPTYTMIQWQSINQAVQLIQSFKNTGTLIESMNTQENSIFHQDFIDLIEGKLSEKEYMQRMSN